MSWTDIALPTRTDNKKTFNPDDILSDFVSEYVEFYSGMNKAVPRDYIEACALFALSSVVGGSVCMKSLASGEEKPNVFIILLGASSVSHKTTPIKVVDRILRNMDEVDFLSGRFSIEGLVMDLRDSPWGVMIRDEFTGLLAEVSKSYVQDLKEFFCEMYDRKIGTRSTIKYGKVIIKDPCNSFLSATTPDNLSSKLRREDYSGGYLPRHAIFYPEPIDDKSGIDMMTKSDMTMEFKITQTLRFILNKFPKGTLTDVRFEGFVDKDNPGNAYKLFNEWVIVNKAIAKEQREEVEPFYARLVDYFIKFSILFQLSDTSTEVIVKGERDKVERYFVLTEKTVNKVCDWMNNYRSYHLNRALRVLSNIEIERVYNLIRGLCEKNKKGKVQYSEVLRSTSYLTDDLRKIMKTLEESNRIRIDRDKSLKDGHVQRKPAEFITLVDAR
jgi:hypothetical protein